MCVALCVSFAAHFCIVVHGHCIEFVRSSWPPSRHYLGGRRLKKSSLSGQNGLRYIHIYMYRWLGILNWRRVVDCAFSHFSPVYILSAIIWHRNGILWINVIALACKWAPLIWSCCTRNILFDFNLGAITITSTANKTVADTTRGQVSSDSIKYG